jgi:predicted N-acetyltransferase YhbS
MAAGDSPFKQVDRHNSMLYTRNVEFRTLRRDEIELIWTIDRREYIARTYRLQDGKLVLSPLDVDVPGWHPDTVRRTTPLLYECYDRGGKFFAAFDGEKLAGISVLDTVWRGKGQNLLQLEVMHVGRDYRGNGIGTRLFEQAGDAARSCGASGLYISATPSENTVHFYQRRGARLVAIPDAELFAKEPEDIHLECFV